MEHLQMTNICPVIIDFIKEKSDATSNLSDNESSCASSEDDTSSDESSLAETSTSNQTRIFSETNEPCDGALNSRNAFSSIQYMTMSEKPNEQSSDINESASVSLGNPASSIVEEQYEVLNVVPSSVNNFNLADSSLTDVINNASEKEDCINNKNTRSIGQQTESFSGIQGRDLCLFCKTMVLNFSRHVVRHHSNEHEVQKIISQPKKSRERISLLLALRKKGNFLLNCNKVTKSMRNKIPTDYLPCHNCLGFYSRKHLWRHMTKCTGGKRSNYVQADAQNLLVRQVNINENLEKYVFSRMRADPISFVAKTDFLICAFGSDCLKNPTVDKKFINEVSRKMRLLAKLLVEIKKNNPAIKNMFDALKPKHFDVIVKATKIIGRYNPDSDCYECLSMATNILKTVRECCNIAITLALEKSDLVTDMITCETESELKAFIHIIDTKWKCELSGQNAINLNKNQNKINTLTLANDIKILMETLTEKSQTAAYLIKENSYNVSTYLLLLETVYCRVLLLNRCSPNQLLRIRLQEYSDSESRNYKKQIKLNKALTVSEQVLVKKFKMIPIKAKRGRLLPILFDLEVQNDLKLLLSIRNLFISTTNPFLFPNPGFENTIGGYKVIKKHAKFPNTTHPPSISTAWIRKYVATFTQIFSMSEDDLEQLAILMGHSKEKYKLFRLADDVHQAAKLFKILIIMKDKNTDLFKEMFQDDIELDINEEIAEQNIKSIVKRNDGETSQLSNSESDNQAQSSLIERKKRILIPWTAEQKNVVTEYFKCHIKKCQSPKRHECEFLKEQHPELLSNKDWQKIKCFVHNTFKKK